MGFARLGCRRRAREVEVVRRHVLRRQGRRPVDLGTVPPRRLAELARHARRLGADAAVPWHVTAGRDVVRRGAVVLAEPAVKLLSRVAVVVVGLQGAQAHGEGGQGPQPAPARAALDHALRHRLAPVQVRDALARRALRERPHGPGAEDLRVRGALLLGGVGDGLFLKPLARPAPKVEDALERRLGTELLRCGGAERRIERPVRGGAVVRHPVRVEGPVHLHWPPPLLAHGQVVPLVVDERLAELLLLRDVDVPGRLAEVLLGPSSVQPAPRRPVVPGQVRVTVVRDRRLPLPDAWRALARDVETHRFMGQGVRVELRLPVLLHVLAHPVLLLFGAVEPLAGVNEHFLPVQERRLSASLLADHVVELHVGIGHFLQRSYVPLDHVRRAGAPAHLRFLVRRVRHVQGRALRRHRPRRRGARRAQHLNRLHHLDRLGFRR
mmetsp:Transcript_77963/g.203153  ORF Transcript_77963/g.203153 Transcript_77963/m.203153 type:complete len:438 (-) Transcript_77963:1173-2486(-)